MHGIPQIHKGINTVHFKDFSQKTSMPLDASMHLPAPYHLHIHTHTDTYTHSILVASSHRRIQELEMMMI